MIRRKVANFAAGALVLLASVGCQHRRSCCPCQCPASAPVVVPTTPPLPSAVPTPMSLKSVPIDPAVRRTVVE